jgi:hypothetical protein
MASSAAREKIGHPASDDRTGGFGVLDLSIIDLKG